MKKAFSIFILLSLMGLTSFRIHGQDRIRPGILYQPGDTIHAPRYGINAIIPEGWAGILPRETEMFLLMSKDNPQSSIYAFGFEDTKAALWSRWNTGPGIEVENNIKLVRSSKVFERGDAIAADLVVENSTNNMKGYIEARCSEYDRCLVLLLIVPEQFLENSKSGLQQFMDNTEFTKPSMGSIYDDFNWSDILKEKYLATRQVNPYEKSKRNNKLWLCPDGTFKSTIKIKGFGTVDKKIKGNKSGTWEAKGIGQTGVLTLKFKNVTEPLEIPLELREDQLFINNIRYYVMQNTSCR